MLDVGPDAITYEYHGQHHQRAASTKIWAAGVAAGSLTTTLAEQSGAHRNRAGQLELNPTAPCLATLRCSSSET